MSAFLVVNISIGLLLTPTYPKLSPGGGGSGGGEGFEETQSRRQSTTTWVNRTNYIGAHCMLNWQWLPEEIAYFSSKRIQGSCGRSINRLFELGERAGNDGGAGGRGKYEQVNLTALEALCNSNPQTMQPYQNYFPSPPLGPEDEGMIKRFKNQLNYIESVGVDFWYGHKNRLQMRGNVTAAANYYATYLKYCVAKNNGQSPPPYEEGGWNGLFNGKIVEVTNEPFHSNSPATVDQIIDLHMAVGKKLHEEFGTDGAVRVTGPTCSSSSAYFQQNNFSQFLDVYGKFIRSEAGAEMDLFSIHLYDYFFGKKHHPHFVRPRRGTNIEATLDLLEAYSLQQLGYVKQYEVSEYGTIIVFEETGSELTEQLLGEYRFAVMAGINGKLFEFLNRADRIVKANPFLLKVSKQHKAFRLYEDASDGPYNISGPSKPTDLLSFFEFWADVHGDRVASSVYLDADLQSLAILGEEENMDDTTTTTRPLYIVINNLKEEPRNLSSLVLDCGLLANATSSTTNGNNSSSRTRRSGINLSIDPQGTFTQRSLSLNRHTGKLHVAESTAGVIGELFSVAGNCLAGRGGDIGGQQPQNSFTLHSSGIYMWILNISSSSTNMAAENRNNQNQNRLSSPEVPSPSKDGTRREFLAEQQRVTSYSSNLLVPYQNLYEGPRFFFTNVTKPVGTLTLVNLQVRVCLGGNISNLVFTGTNNISVNAPLVRIIGGTCQPDHQCEGYSFGPSDASSYRGVAGDNSWSPAPEDPTTHFCWRFETTTPQSYITANELNGERNIFVSPFADEFVSSLTYPDPLGANPSNFTVVVYVDNPSSSPTPSANTVVSSVAIQHDWI